MKLRSLSPSPPAQSRRPASIVLGGLTCAVLGAAGCGTEARQTPEPEPPVVVTGSTYLRDVQPIIEGKCQSCHVPGGIAPFTLANYAEVKGLSGVIRPAIESGQMPPFMAEGNCRPYQHDIRLSAEELATVIDWMDNGHLEGDPATERHAETPFVPTIRQDKLMDIGGDFDATLMRDDNYRCFAINPEFASDVMVSGYEFIPGNKAIVHHALAYLVEPRDVGTLQGADDADPGMGFECFSNSQIDSLRQVAAWVPGQVPRKLPFDTAIEARAGSWIVLQIHYNLLATSEPPIDRSQLALQLDAMGAKRAADTYSVAQYRLDIPAGEKDVTATGYLPIDATGDGATIYGVTGHMHQLGSALKLEIERFDGERECLLDIRNWDFAWQQTFELVTPTVLHNGDRIRIDCTYDNSVENQPIVRGTQQAPRQVRWGDGSLDEMCLGYLYASLRDQ